MGTQEIIDTYEPVEEGLEMVTEVRTLPCIQIVLSKEPLDTSDKGYQPPTEEHSVADAELDEMAAPKDNLMMRPGGKKHGKIITVEEEEPGTKEERAEELAGRRQEETMNDSVEQEATERFEGFAHKWQEADPAQKITQIEDFWEIYDENQSTTLNNEEMTKIQQEIEEQEEGSV